jgi:hypothetical protein
MPTRPRRAATRVEPQTYTPHTDDLGGRITWHREDGYLAWQGDVCLGEVVNLDEGILVIAEQRTLSRARAANVLE